MARTVVGLFDKTETAHAAVQDLLAYGFARENISFITNDQEGSYIEELKRSDNEKKNQTSKGAGWGAAIGGFSGLLVGLGTFIIPGVGPVLAAGPIIATLGGAGLGALTGGLVGALTEAGISASDASIFSQAVQRGGVLVLAYVQDEQADEAVEIMNRHNPIDIEEHTRHWRDQNWTDEEPSAEPFAFDPNRKQIKENAPENRIRRVRSYPAAGIKDSDAAHQRLLKTTEIENLDPMEDWRMYESRFRDHYQNYYSKLGHWEDFRDSYRYGYRLGSHGPYMNVEWDQISGEVRQEWEIQHPEWEWNDHEEAVRQGWLVSRSRQ